jgi:hypothetical protein
MLGKVFFFFHTLISFSLTGFTSDMEGKHSARDRESDMYNILFGKLMGNRTRQRREWEDNIKMQLRKTYSELVLNG